MKRFLGLLLLSGLIYGGYVFYQQYTDNSKESSVLPPISSSSLIISDPTNKLSNLAAVLGASIASTYENGKELLNDATNGASEPIINELVSKTTETLKDLPRREAEKIKYEFCKGVITEYENK